MLGSIKKIDKNIKIVVSSYDKDLTTRRDKVESFTWPVNIKKIAEKKFIFLQFITAFVEIISSFMLLYCPNLIKESGKIYDYFEKADIVLCPGGHLFTSMNPLISLWSYTISILIAKKMNKTIIGLSQTIGPFDGMNGIIAEYFSKKAITNMDLILLRDKSSEKILEKFKIKNINYAFAGEIVYLLNTLAEKQEYTFREIKQQKINIGITIHHLYFKYYMSRGQYTNMMSAFCNLLVENYNVNIIFLPMEYTKEGPKDRVIICEIIKKINKKESVSMIEKDLQPDEILHFMKKLDFFVGTKTHSIVMSLLAGTPTLCVSYHEKSHFFMNEWGVGEYSINLKSIDNEVLLKLFEKLYDNSTQIRKILKKSRMQMESQAYKNFENIWKNLCEKHD